MMEVCQIQPCLIKMKVTPVSFKGDQKIIYKQKIKKNT